MLSAPFVEQVIELVASAHYDVYCRVMRQQLGECHRETSHKWRSVPSLNTPSRAATIQRKRERGSGVLPPSQSNSVEFMRIFFSNESLTTMRAAPSAGRRGHCLSSGGNFSGQELEASVTFLLLSFCAFHRTHALPTSFFFRVVRALVWR